MSPLAIEVHDPKDLGSKTAGATGEKAGWQAWRCIRLRPGGGRSGGERNDGSLLWLFLNVWG